MYQRFPGDAAQSPEPTSANVQQPVPQSIQRAVRVMYAGVGGEPARHRRRHDYAVLYAQRDTQTQPELHRGAAQHRRARADRAVHRRRPDRRRALALDGAELPGGQGLGAGGLDRVLRHRHAERDRRRRRGARRRPEPDLRDPCLGDRPDRDHPAVAALVVRVLPRPALPASGSAGTAAPPSLPPALGPPWRSRARRGTAARRPASGPPGRCSGASRAWRSYRGSR